MKHKKVVAFVALAVVLAGLWLLRPFSPRQERKPDKAGEPVPSKLTAKEVRAPSIPAQVANGQPRLFKSTRYPPETPEEKAMWDWWRAMNKTDPDFQWKMPIQFYGKVIDQFGEPVAGATVHLTWTAIDDSHEKEILSGSDGRFEFTGFHGKRLGVSVWKIGYLPTRNASAGFEYAEFSNEMFHVPDIEKPVVFRLQKLVESEPMLKFITNAEVDVASVPVVLNVETGNLGSDGDLSFSIIKGTTGHPGSDYTIMITAMGGAAFVFSDAEFMFNAPEAGYQTTAVFDKNSPNRHGRVQPYRFYVKTRSGKYAAVEGDITLREGLSDGKAGFHAIIYYNPSGSRNLEFDHRKWLNP